MSDLTHAGLFVGASLALLMTPGPAVLYIVTRSIGRGRRAGLVSVLGICTGTLVHVAAAALGLSALLVSSALAFNVVKWLGAFLPDRARHWNAARSRRAVGRRRRPGDG